MNKSITKLSRDIGYHFNDEQLLVLALTHRSFGSKNNERLEYLGDSILNFIIAEALFQKFPQAKEGQLIRLRARMVCCETLANIGREFNLGDYLKMGSGELKSGGFRRDSILEDATEAIIGAIYLDMDMDTCKERVLSWFASRLGALTIEDTKKDPKTRLQEYLQSRKLALPKYVVLEVCGAAHEQNFKVECVLEGMSTTTLGLGNSRRVAEQKSAREALIRLGVDNEQ